MAQLIVTQSTDYRTPPSEVNIDEVVFTNASGTVIAVFGQSQFQPGGISNGVTFTGTTGGTNGIHLHSGGGGAGFSAAGWQFQNWGRSDFIYLIGSAGDDIMEGTSLNDVLFNGGGQDALEGGAGSDNFHITSPPDAGSIFDGGSQPAAGFDTMRVFASGLTDLRAVEIVGMERLKFEQSGQTVVIDATAMGGGAIATVIGSGDGQVNALRVDGSGVDLSGVSFVGWSFEDDIVLAGTILSDTLIGSDKDDTFNGLGGPDNLTGGAGNDTYVNPDTAAIHEDIDGGIDTVTSTVSFSLAGIANVEQLTLTGGGDIDGTGNALDNRVRGNAENNVLDGGAGEDALAGSSGFDTLRGGEGDDLLDGGADADTLEGGAGDDDYYNWAGDTIVEAAGAAGGLHDRLVSGASISLAGIANVEDILLTGNNAANGIGSPSANVITGNGAANILNGGGGNDRLDGGAGADTLNGGAGNDLYIIPDLAGGDTIGEAAGAAGGLHDKVQTLFSFNLSSVANVEDLTLAGGGNINGIGDNFDNVITGNGGANVLNGGGGADTLTGAGGNDTMNGGGGADLFKFAVAATGADTIGGFETALDRFDLAGGTFSARSEAAGNTTLTHAGGTIIVTGVSGLSLVAWNALVLSGARGADAGAVHGHPAFASFDRFDAADFLYA